MGQLTNHDDATHEKILNRWMKAYSQIDFYKEYLKAQVNEDLVRSSFWAAKTLQQFPLHEV